MLKLIKNHDKEKSMAKILIIEDDEKFRKMLRQMLERAGYEIEEAPNGEEGIKLYTEKPTDLIITDIFMPEKEGIETIIEIKRDFPNAKIIAISGGGRTRAFGFLDQVKSLGVERTFTKPFERNVIIESIQELLFQDTHGSK